MSFEDCLRRSYVLFINHILHNDSLVSDIIPLNPSGPDLFEAIRLGVVPCAIINQIRPRTLDHTKIKKNPKSRYEASINHELVISAAHHLGCRVSEITSAGLYEQNSYQIFEFLWQLTRRYLIDEVSISKHPSLLSLRKSDEDQKSFCALPAEEILCRWANYHVHKVSPISSIHSLADLQDGQNYLHLINQMDPELYKQKRNQNYFPLDVLQEVLRLAGLRGCLTFFTADELVVEVKFHVALLAMLFSSKPDLDSESLTPKVKQRLKDLPPTPPKTAVVPQKQVRVIDADEVVSKTRNQNTSQKGSENEEWETRRREFRNSERVFSEQQRELIKQERERSSRQKTEAFKDKDENSATQQLNILSEKQIRVQEEALEYLKQTEEVLKEKYQLLVDHISQLLGNSHYLQLQQDSHMHLTQESDKVAEELRSVQEEIKVLTSRREAHLEMTRLDSYLLGDISEHRPGYRKIFVTIKEARNIAASDSICGSSNPFVIVRHVAPDSTLIVKHRTRAVQPSTNPYWDETMEYRNFREDDTLEITIWDEGLISTDFLGGVILKRSDIRHGASTSFPLSNMTSPNSVSSSSLPGSKSSSANNSRASPNSTPERLQTQSSTPTLLSSSVDKKSFMKIKQLNLGGVENFMRDTLQKSRSMIKNQMSKKIIVTGDIIVEFDTVE
eukprot:TRINITY_DN3542_c0_g2_i1.p1 TRINITY_DN3542_c0_g2~~TRINITY_DN3542_c0_g2_i1.p1  ORF type:complete len:673 (+),score=125.65 TRINITY_DN3542_c0_g2_i1:37-2055(+)